MATLIDGKAIAAKVRAEVAEGVKARVAKGLRAPGLAVVRVGEDPASKIYIGGKRKACAEVGMQSWEHVFPETATQDEVAARLRELNADPAVHGILVQLPIPKQLDDRALLNLVDAKKDVDGFHPMNLGALVMGLPAPRACTPFGVMRLLQEAGCDPSGKRAVVIGRSLIVGKPMALMLLEANATVTVCHSKTKDLPAVVREADILVAAIGKGRFVQGDWVKPGAVVIDVGMNRQADGKLWGDVDFEPASQRASAITPVPGGVGPMTIAMLIRNTLNQADRFDTTKV
ncbi:MAG: bifunctional methylenetetrahydrofolate dehydrogenase/methenyltetrahydrofolate cyclohydrolase FolD [Deltaproteobacteria bacterium]|nr:bifunctional methylenetetrahydrofolate dehydrogenase/methenyltetrahydrofolate cyclohydrolase FolD [Deltaproteobacteria bacterium]